MFLIANRFVSGLLAKVVGEEAGLLSEEQQSMISSGKNPFSRYLPYLAYDPETKLYYNKDGTVGFMFIASPLWSENEKAYRILTSLIKDLPEKSTLSFHLLSLDHIEPLLQKYLALKKVRNDPLIMEAAKRHVDFLRKATKQGIPHMLGTPLRNFVLLVSIKYPGNRFGKDRTVITETHSSLFELLRGAYLNPQPLEPDLLIRILFNLFNSYWLDSIHWDPYRSISSQIILADTEIEVLWKRIKMGERFFACVTPKQIPTEISPYLVSALTGSREGSREDGRQISSHFLFSLLIHSDEKLHAEIMRKGSLFMNQLKGDAEKSLLGRLIGEYASEHYTAVNEIERGKRFFYYFPILWLWHSDESKLRQAVQKAQNLFSENGFPPQEERGILLPLFLMSLPFGFTLKPTDIATLDRHFIDLPEKIAYMVPVVGDISGIGDPSFFFISRKGQLVSFDPFNRFAPNKNMVVFGSTGHGKSFNLNVLTYALYASGTLVRIIDLGYSYQKQCKLFKGDYIDFNVERPLCLNPFTFLNVDDQEDLRGGLSSIANLVETMIFAGSQERITKEHKALIRYAVEWTFKEWGTEGHIGHVREYLAKFPEFAGEEMEGICEATMTGDGADTCLPDLRQEAQKLAFALNEWVSPEIFGEWFVGRANVDLVSAEYLVLELERLKRIPKLLSVVSVAIIDAVTATLYLLERSLRKFLLFEECGIILKGNPFLQETVEEVYRRVRKYNGAAATVFQGPLDLEGLSTVGKTIVANSAYMFCLPSDQYASAAESKSFGISKEMAEVLKTVELVRPRYGEIGLKTPFGFGVVRNVPDGFLYYVCTTDPEEWHKIETLKREKMKELNETDRDELERKALIEAIKEMGRAKDEWMEKTFISS